MTPANRQSNRIESSDDAGGVDDRRAGRCARLGLNDAADVAVTGES